MQVRVLFFGILKDLTGRSSETLTLPDRATAGDLLEHYENSLSKIRGRLSSIAVSVNQEYATAETTLKAGDEVALLPPVSGGSGPEQPVAGPQSSKAAIVRGKIDTAGVLTAIKRPEDGAAVVFEGVVRNHTRGRRTLLLDYEAYEEMALKEMDSLISQALLRFQIRDAAIVHRLGRLEVGEISVLIIVASAHRSAAFEACRWLIDMLKRTVPIWKKEFFEDGAVWADGEPFPEQLAAGTFSTDPASK